MSEVGGFIIWQSKFLHIFLLFIYFLSYININMQWSTTDSSGILELAMAGDADGLRQYLLHHPEAVNLKDSEHGNVALHIAASKGRVDMVQIIAKYGGVDFNAKVIDFCVLSCEFISMLCLLNIIITLNRTYLETLRYIMLSIEVEERSYSYFYRELVGLMLM
jgi:ankyrin repeat protein